MKVAQIAGLAFVLIISLASCDKKAKRMEAEKVYVAAVEAYAAEQYADSLELARWALKLDSKFYQAAFLEGCFYSRRCGGWRIHKSWTSVL